MSKMMGSVALSTRWKLAAGLMLCLAAVLGACLWSAGDATGARAEGRRLERMRKSTRWDPRGQRFTNSLKRVDGPWWEMTGKFFLGGSDHRAPTSPPPTTRRTAKELATQPASGLRVTWFGHSTLLVEVDGVRTLVDPVWSERASPFRWAGPKRFYPPPAPLEDLPPLDAVVISHDHYDHLDRDTVKALAARTPIWLTPLGVGAHLEAWGVRPERIVELDWWQSHPVGDVTLTATPSRHFSGRSITFGDQNATLWAGWAWSGPAHRVFYSGDTALHDDFGAIGERLGPFDLTLMEAGAYDQLWCDVHLGPEQAALAHRLVRGGVMMPVHWGLFDLALHGWTEPAERIVAAARRVGVELALVRPGASYDIADPPEVDRWWPQTPWQTVTEAPAWSTSVGRLQAPMRAPR